MRGCLPFVLSLCFLTASAGIVSGSRTDLPVIRKRGVRQDLVAAGIPVKAISNFLNTPLANALLSFYMGVLSSKMAQRRAEGIDPPGRPLKPSRVSFESLDKDGDGFVSAEELREATQETVVLTLGAAFELVWMSVVENIKFVFKMVKDALVSAMECMVQLWEALVQLARQLGAKAASPFVSSWKALEFSIAVHSAASVAAAKTYAETRVRLLEEGRASLEAMRAEARKESAAAQTEAEARKKEAAKVQEAARAEEAAKTEAAKAEAVEAQVTEAAREAEGTTAVSRETHVVEEPEVAAKVPVEATERVIGAAADPLDSLWTPQPTPTEADVEAVSPSDWKLFSSSHIVLPILYLASIFIALLVQSLKNSNQNFVASTLAGFLATFSKKLAA